MKTDPPPQSTPSPLARPGIERIWISAAAALGWRVERSTAVFAASDGAGRLLIGSDEILDSHDAVAQLVFHELCHALVEGPERWSAPDWGLSNFDQTDAVREHACLRVQVHLTQAVGLRELMAPTTEYRAYHDAIRGDPLTSPSDPAAGVARDAVERSTSRQWLEVLARALAETHRELAATSPGEPGGGRVAHGSNAAIEATVARDDGDGSAVRVEPGLAAPPALHPVGFPLAKSNESCATCAWLYRGGRGQPVDRCRQAAGPDGNGRRTDGRFQACERWEAPVACQSCGACCREAYHSVTVSMRDPVVWKRPELIVRTGPRFEILRAGERCAALLEQRTVGDAPPGGGDHSPPLRAPSAGQSGFACAIYEERPRACRDFEAGGRHCLVARRRVGLSP